MTTNSAPDRSEPATEEAVLHEILRRRRSAREFAASPLPEEQIRDLCWAAQGVTDSAGHRAAPSPGATYALELYAVTAAGAFHYEPEWSGLSPYAAGDLRTALGAAAGQESVARAAAVIVVAAVPSRLAARFGPGNERLLFLEAGHAAQNVLLQAVALGLSAMPVGVFDDAAIRETLSLGPDVEILELVLAGAPA